MSILGFPWLASGLGGFLPAGRMWLSSVEWVARVLIISTFGFFFNTNQKGSRKTIITCPDMFTSCLLSVMSGHVWWCFQAKLDLLRGRVVPPVLRAYLGNPTGSQALIAFQGQLSRNICSRGSASGHPPSKMKFNTHWDSLVRNPTFSSRSTSLVPPSGSR